MVELYLYSPYRTYGLYRAPVPVHGCTLPYLSACTRVHFTLPQCLYKGTLYLTPVPVQGYTLPYPSACTKVHFTLPQCLYKGTLYLTPVPVQGCTLPTFTLKLTICKENCLGNINPFSFLSSTTPDTNRSLNRHRTL